MDDDYRGLDSEIFTLIVGQEQKRLVVQKDILTMIPYFKTALSSGQFTESTNNTFQLPEDNAKAVADVLYSTYTGTVEKLSCQDDEGFENGFEEVGLVESYIHAYIVADKYKAEKAANHYLDGLVQYYQNSVVHPHHLGTLSKAGLQHSSLYDLLLRDIAWSLKDEYWLDMDLPCVDEGKFTTFSEACQQMSVNDMWQVALATSRGQYKVGDKSPLRLAREDLCKYHKHDLTTRCVAQEKDADDKN